MPTGRIDEAIRQLRRVAVRQDGAGMTDAQLLECFVVRRDEAAFAALVRRHGPMVWNVCGRVLRNLHDAEDAFQATFLVLVRKADSVVPRERVANWLYGVAFQIARKARAVAARKQAREKQVTEIPEPAIQEPDDCPDLWPVLDRELSLLPDKYRSAILYCDLEGKTRKEAAGNLGVPEGTLSGWLSRGRALLAKRLARRGLSASAGVLAVGLARGASAGAVPAGVLSAAIRAVAEAGTSEITAAGPVSPAVELLAKGVLRTMLVRKLRRGVLAVAVLGAIGLWGGFLSRHTATAQQGKPAAPPKEGTPAARASAKAKANRYVEAVQKDLAALQGEWEIESFAFSGKRLDLPEDRAKRTLVISGNEATTYVGPQEVRATWLIDPTRELKSLDICYEKEPPDAKGEKPALGGKVGAAIYQIDGDTLKVSGDEPGNPRPDAFLAFRGTQRFLLVYKRIKR
jgi:RNA polymerase sigma factor (sigma-70 family)